MSRIITNKFIKDNSKGGTMKRIRLATMAMMIVLMVSGIAHATPSTTYWTPMTVDIQSYGVPHIGVDNYFTVFKKVLIGMQN